MAKHVVMKVQERKGLEFFNSHIRSKIMDDAFNHQKKITFNLAFYAESCSQNSVG